MENLGFPLRLSQNPRRSKIELGGLAGTRRKHLVCGTVRRKARYDIRLEFRSVGKRALRRDAF
jgi:hypothetical protein